MGCTRADDRPLAAASAAASASGQGARHPINGNVGAAGRRLLGHRRHAWRLAAWHGATKDINIKRGGSCEEGP